MAGFLDQFRKKVFSSVWKDKSNVKEAIEIDDKIALGVLVWEVAQADSKFLPEEREKLVDILKEYAHISDNDMPVVLKSIEVASAEKIDLYTFTHEVSHSLVKSIKIEIIENLFRVACIDKDLAHEEVEAIRKISGLFRLDHEDFISAKIKIKKEFGLNVAGM